MTMNTTTLEYHPDWPRAEDEKRRDRRVSHPDDSLL